MTKACLVLALVGTLAGFPASALAAARVSSNSNCPSSEAISVRLLGLLAAGGPEQASARVSSDGRTMQVEVSTPGEEIHQRSLLATGDCDTRAETAALIIATWLDAMPVGTLRAPGIPPREVRLEASSGGGDDSFYDPDAQGPSIGKRTLVGLGLFGTTDGQGTNAGFFLEAGMPSLVDQFGWVFRSSLGLPRQLDVGGGTARYWRPTFSLATSMGVQGRNWAFRVQAGPALAGIFVNGKGYADNRSESTVMWGFDGGLVAARRFRRLEGWLRLGFMGWPQGRSIRSGSHLGGAETAVALPGWEMCLSGGFSWAIY